jgi:serine phosphatase RsbU (regulator of sigma subunit)
MATAAGLIDWGVATRSSPGEAQSGDRHVVATSPDVVLVAAIDGLGHGPEAALAAGLAAATLEHHAQEPVASLVERCHERLASTRGVVMSLAAFDPRASTMTWLGVGNVAGVLLRADPETLPRGEWLLLRGGLVGFKLPPLRSATFRISSGDTLCFATDGIRADFAEELSVHGAPQRIADRILARCAKGTDDALVLVARYRSGLS